MPEGPYKKINSPESQKIIMRFQEAFFHLVNRGEIATIVDFTEKYDITYSHFHRAITNPQRRIFQMEWLSILVRDYEISANWLLTGSGMISTKKGIASTAKIPERRSPGRPKRS